MSYSGMEGSTDRHDTHHSYTDFLKILGRSTELVHDENVPDEFFSVEKLEQLATGLAAELRTTTESKKSRSLRPLLKQNQIKLEEAYKILANSIQEKHPVSPAAEWFVDNFHLIEGQLREIKQGLPDDYYYGLPQLSGGELQGFPRVYAIALYIVAHTDGRIDPHTLHRFLKSFQTTAPLQVGELWALVITLRFGLVQHLSQLATKIIRSRENREKADKLADRLLTFAIRPDVTEKDIIQMLEAEITRANQSSRSFMVQLIQRLRDQDPAVSPAFEWIEKKLASSGTNSQKITQLELHRLASGQVTIGNIIGSMRLITNQDWREFIEGVNLVDPILAQDPMGAYLQMDFATRDRYRHVIETIANRSELTESAVAERAIAASQTSAPGGIASHVGHHLIGLGKNAFKKSCGYRPTLQERFPNFILAHPTFVYLGSLTLVTSLLLAPVVYYFSVSATNNLPLILAFALLAVLPASDLALSFLNHYITFFMRPEPLPRMDWEKGIPVHAQTMVVIPTLFTKESVVRELIEKLEIQSLANRDTHLSFALLGDFGDAETATTASDDELLRIASAGIHELNQKYYPESEPHFHLFVRKRLWNEAEGAWIGWERKRGKLLEFNRLLRGDKNTSYILATADDSMLTEIKYVITLDSDTQLPRDAAQKLVGTITHPLNQPILDHKTRRVTAGYGILQPRISVTSSSAIATRFARISSGNIGIDPYTTAVSDVYQDLFAEGSFTGKGLYVVDAFEEAMEGRVPENKVLSHDLFESSYARSALVTDVELFDDYPEDYETFSKRGHRWTRGDWQLLPWLLPFVKNGEGKTVRNDLSVISRWKLFDNLRRSMVPVATLIWLGLAWTVLPGSPFLWTSLILIMFLFPVYSTVATGDWMRRRGRTWYGHFQGGWRETKIKIGQILLTATFLAKQAWTQADAIVRVLFRMFISRKKLLEWTSFAQLSSQKKKTGILDSGPIIAAIMGVVVFLVRPEALLVAGPFIALWALNPFIKKWIAQKPTVKEVPLTVDEHKQFRLYARSIWSFFEEFVGPLDHWLAPDNFQEDPRPVIAHRTSPTNIGLQVLAAASAYDLGYIGEKNLISQLENTFATLDRLPKLHGHFYNWYDTLSLHPLEPRYISTVDSGNLAGHLLTLKQFLVEIQKDSRPVHELNRGIEDTLLLLQVEVDRIPNVTSSTNVFHASELQRIIKKCLHIAQTPPQAKDWKKILSTLLVDLTEGQDILGALLADSIQHPEELKLSKHWIDRCLKQVSSLKDDLTSDKTEILTCTNALIAKCDEMVQNMDFKFLYDRQRKLFVIGYNCLDNRMDNSFYDLLASESRLASFVAIAKGDVSQEHWFRLGRQMTPLKNGRALIAWTATMFEYLMPVLVMRRFDNTLLEETYHSIVQRQMEYGQEKGVPWGVSEAGYNARDLQMNYQYGPFGVPGLGLKRGLSDELVISPYSTMLAALINPRAALANLDRMKKLGVHGRYGFYESIDYTAERLPARQSFVILRSFMAHHQGMSLVALNNLVHDNIMQRRFHNEPQVQATELILQERVPQSLPLLRPRVEEIKSDGFLLSATEIHPRLYSDVNLSLPRTQILSNGTYSVMVTSTGAGYSRCGPLSISRWREDTTRDHWGQFFYIRDRATDKFWSATHQPTGTAPDSFGATFSEDKVEFWRKDDEILTRTEILVSPEDNVELRKITLSNESDKVVEIEVTSFMETVIAKHNDDAAHPTFSNLFVQTESVANGAALLATRRARSNHEIPPWAFHVVTTDGAEQGAIQYETDRSRFVGRGRNSGSPTVITENKPLSNSVGSVLDPIFSLRQTIRIQPKTSASVTFATGLVQFREEALDLIDKYRDFHTFHRESEMAWTHAQVQLRHINISHTQAHIYQRLAGRVLYLDSSLRPASNQLSKNTRAQTNLWAYGISGDVPIILTQISDEKDMPMVRELLRAHEYMRLKGLKADLVILNERSHSYLQSLQDEIQRQILISGSHSLLHKAGGIFLLRSDLLPREDLILLKTVARVNLSAEIGTLEEQLKHRKPRSVMPEPFVAKPLVATKAPPINKGINLSQTVSGLQFYNGLGGFTPDAREYVITLSEDQWTPAPWINVIANSKDFGFIISESGSGFTWSDNSRENRLTPWSNDPVTDPPGEVIYLKDEETGEFWTPTPLPIRGNDPYIISHGQGYSRFEHISHNIEQTMDVFVSMNDNVKFSRLKIKNLSSTPRKLSVTSYVEWVLGLNRSTSAAYVIPQYDEATGAILAHNPYNNEFASRVAFTDISRVDRTYTCDRREFLGRNGSPGNPAALRRVGLSGTSGAGLDPCAAFQTKIDLAPGEEQTIVIIIGQTTSDVEARKLVLKYRDMAQVNSAYTDSVSFWDQALSTLTINTPDKAMNTLVNRWLLYQTLSCRVWARSAFYQSGGAFGFRDQLQDVMAVAYAHPEITRAQILTSAARQFKEGDVQHWWHPPTGRGVRTHFSDDLIWLPFVVSHYIKVTGDISILKEVIPFIEAPLLAQGQEDSYTHPNISEEKGTIFEHCARALDRSMKVGKHGLPLMGAGDWNDGMNRVGHAGQGESVWVAWFLYSTLTQFIPLCDLMDNEDKRAAAYIEHLTQLKKAVEKNAWDGDWYRRAYFDDGTPLGSAQNEECKIDSISQSWSVLSGAADKDRMKRAMAAVDEYLIHRGDGLIKLFAPPFDKTSLDPGYIKGYVPGVRENGGQYTHAAIWTLMAYAELGDGDRAQELYALLNPINHSSTRAGLHKYKVEPYVVAADIYGLYPHVGRGGWTWYTGSASWMYRSAVESILGLDMRGDTFTVRPKVPLAWKEFDFTYRFKSTTYHISLVRAEGQVIESEWHNLIDDGKEHNITITFN
ncbi:MAG TPA: glucoamylase family protein [Bacteriovoracaceae bacterium]|nr:glucoamylase family protein [Bacteriovoracaceae bacterium]